MALTQWSCTRSYHTVCAWRLLERLVSGLDVIWQVDATTEVLADAFHGMHLLCLLRMGRWLVGRMLRWLLAVQHTAESRSASILRLLLHRLLQR